jgi:ABC-type polysaccharide/polyol phosphate transport system ATPase subunit
VSEPAIAFDRVWKKFKLGERHDSLRDLIPATVRRLTGRTSTDALRQDEFWVLRDVSFAVAPGEAFGIIGHNGAGKSTTLKLLTRILRPTRGECRVRGRVGALIEIAAGFHPDLTGRENVFLQGAVIGMKRRDIAARFDDIIAFAGLEQFVDTQVKRYSSGMNARLGFSIAAHFDPEVLLIDEVLAVGDFSFQQRCYERLEEFRRRGVAIALVSHNLQAVASLCKRAMLLSTGGAPLVADVGTVLAAYTNLSPASSHDRVRVLRAALRRGASSDALKTPLSPGDQVVLDLEIVSDMPLDRCGLGLQITRSDGLVVFEGASNIAGPSIDLPPGVPFKCEIRFTANLLRGTYVVAGFLRDRDKIWQPIMLTGLATFIVNETTRLRGCVEVYPEYEMQPVYHATAQKAAI